MKRQFLPAAVQYYQKRKIVERLVNQPVKAIWYYTPDNRKLTSSQAVFLPKIQIQRLQLEFADASAIWLNFGKTSWKVDDKLTVAPLGFYAKGKDFEAETGCRDGLWFDYWQGENGCFLNSRNYDWTLEPLGSTYHGRGEGKSPVGRPGPVTPWGKPALGYKTRKKKNPTDKFIVKRRNVK